MNYWLMKSEPSEFSVDDLARCGSKGAPWFGIRNYQVRNFMLHDMRPNDKMLFWHSSCKNVGIYGVGKINSEAYPDITQFDIDSKYFDPKSIESKPRWWCVDVVLEYKTRYLSIGELRNYSDLRDLQVLQKGNRLSITKLSVIQWNLINNLLKE